jgi:hypothetical protein
MERTFTEVGLCGDGVEGVFKLKFMDVYRDVCSFKVLSVTVSIVIRLT